MGSPVTLTTELADYTFEGIAGSATLQVAFVNDQGVGHDVVLDYLQRGGATYQAEAQSINTGQWGRQGGCGSGGPGQMMHCNGYVEFPGSNQAPARVSGASSIRVYPNPTDQEVRLALSSDMPGASRVDVLNLHGQLVHTQAVSDPRSIVLSVSTLSPGTYLIKVTADNQTATQRLIVR